MPHGCFEQTSATTYPMVMGLKVLRKMKVQTGDLDQQDEIDRLTEEIEEKLAIGYKRLISYETPTKGFEWFGHSPGHEALTAFGLQQFLDMSKISDIVDFALIERTFDWLLSRKELDSNGFETGKFIVNDVQLDTFGYAA